MEDEVIEPRAVDGGLREQAMKLNARLAECEPKPTPIRDLPPEIYMQMKNEFFTILDKVRRNSARCYLLICSEYESVAVWL
jgi:hypothetical protein